MNSLIMIQQIKKIEMKAVTVHMFYQVYNNNFDSAEQVVNALHIRLSPQLPLLTWASKPQYSKQHSNMKLKMGCFTCVKSMKWKARGRILKQNQICFCCIIFVCLVHFILVQLLCRRKVYIALIIKMGLTLATFCFATFTQNN